MSIQEDFREGIRLLLTEIKRRGTNHVDQIVLPGRSASRMKPQLVREASRLGMTLPPIRQLKGRIDAELYLMEYGTKRPTPKRTIVIDDYIDTGFKALDLNLHGNFYLVVAGTKAHDEYRSSLRLRAPDFIALEKRPDITSWRHSLRTWIMIDRSEYPPRGRSSRR